MVWIKSVVIHFIFLALYVNGQGPGYKICALSQYEHTLCSQLMRGKSDVTCQIVQDGIECAQRIHNGTADFGVFPAENVLLLATLNWETLTIVKQMRSTEREIETTDYESVVVVHKEHQGGVDGLKGKNFCHPGFRYDKSQRWTERFLKFFERQIVPADCGKSESPAEIETRSLSQYFGKACRPGKWSHNLKEDAALKRKYPSLCELCNSDLNSCDYANIPSTPGLNIHHQQALNCLKRGGNVAYVSREDAQKFFQADSSLALDYRYLCPNGTVHPVTMDKPCTWLRQPWGVILGRSDKSVALSKSIEAWLNQPGAGSWQSALKELMGENYKAISTTMQSPVDYMRVYRETPYARPLCSTDVSWCTTSHEEKDKCDIVRAAGISTGLFPVINCQEPRQSVVNCLDEINQKRVDFMGIDSNYGYLARNLYNLTPALYFETEMDQYSSIVVVVREGSKLDSFEKLKKAKACLPEFASTPAMAFINLGKNRGFFKRDECRYGRLLHNFFGDSCAPGAADLRHDRSGNKQESLCALCKSSNSPNLIHQRKLEKLGAEATVQNSDGSVNCAANPENINFGNRGALRCLSTSGEVAILELQSLQQHAIDLNLKESDYRIICRNGSLANRPGFDVDLGCALTTIVDGEIVARRKSEKIPGIVNVLAGLDTYLQNDPDFKMYNIFAGEKHLLFKDSTIGLTAWDEDTFGPAVENYIRLFANLEDCVQGNSGAIFTVNIFITLFLSFFVTIRYLC